MDSHQDAKNSQIFLAKMEVSQHKECEITVTVESKSNPNNGGGNKFKVCFAPVIKM